MCKKKRYWAALAAGTAVGAWCVHRNRKYPVLPELRFANKLVVPGCMLNVDTVKLANRTLSRMALPSPPQGIECRRYQIPSEDGTTIRLTVYRPEAIDQALPCLVYFHGGGFCLGGAGYIHRYAAQYAQGAQCAVAFVHYRTSDTAPFPVPFQDCYAAPMLVSDFSGLPPAYVEVEEFDCLHDEGLAYAQALKMAGVEVQLEDVSGTFHGFDFFAEKDISQIMVWRRVLALRRVFDK